MNTLFNQPFDDIDENDLNNLVYERKTREYVSLDYKQEYTRNDKGVVGLLIDVTAMANSRGGYILIGVEEDKSAPDGTPKSIVGIEKGDEEANRIRNICLVSIDEIIVGLRIRDILLSNGKYCVLIQIPNSVKKPHMVIHEKHRSISIRHERLNSRLDMRQVRDMVISMNSYQGSLQSFIQDRIDENLVIAEGVPFFLYMATPIYIEEEKLDPLQEEYRNLFETNYKIGIPDVMYQGMVTNQIHPRIFGIEGYTISNSPKTIPYNTIRLFRNGHLEFIQRYDPEPNSNWPVEPQEISPYPIAIYLVNFLSVIEKIITIADISDPIAISLILGNFQPSLLKLAKKHKEWSDNPIWNKNILRIDTTVNDLDKPNEVANFMMDRLYNAYGYKKNLHFDENMVFIINR